MLLCACYARLQEALTLYKARHKNEPSDTRAVLGCMKCLDAMGEWGDLVDLCNSSWDTLAAPGEDPAVHRKAATMAARYCCWCIGFDGADYR